MDWGNVEVDSYMMRVGNIFSISKHGEDYELSEECDGYYRDVLTRDEVIRLARAMIDFVGEK